MNKRKIIFAARYYKPCIGGVENSLYNMCKSALSMGIDAEIVATNIGLTRKDYLPLQELDGNITVSRFATTKLPKFLFFLSPLVILLDSYRGFKRIKSMNKNALIIARTHCIAYAACLVGFDSVVYIVPSLIKGLSDRKDKSLNFKGRFKESLILYSTIYVNNWIQKKAIIKVDKCYVFSENMGKQIIELFGNAKSVKPMLIRPGVDSSRFFFDSLRKSEMRKKYNLKEEFIFLCLGRITETKGFSDVLNAFYLLPEYLRMKSRVLVVGDGTDSVNLRNIANNPKISENVVFFDATSCPEEFFVMADCFMMTSRYEAFGQTIIEAMASGLPIIAYEPDGTNIKTASNELIVDGVNGFFCQFNIQSLCNTMQKVINLSVHEYSKIQCTNIEEINKKHSWDSLVRTVLELT